MPSRPALPHPLPSAARPTSGTQPAIPAGPRGPLAAATSRDLVPPPRGRRRGWTAAALALGAVALGAGTVAGPRAAHAEDAPPAPAAPAAGAIVVVETFDDTALDRWKLTGVSAAERGGDGGEARSFEVRVTGSGDAEIALAFDAPRDWRGFDALVLRASVASGPARPMRVRLATGAAGEGGFVRRFRLAPGGPAETVLPLRDFRDDGRRVVGDFRRVGRLRIGFDPIEGASPEALPPVRFGAVALRRGGDGERSCEPTPAERLAVAFPGGAGVAHAGTHVLMLTDAPALRGDDGPRLVRRLDAACELAAATYGLDAGRGAPAVLHVAADRDGYLACIARHAQHFAVGIAPPASDGYTVLRRAFSWYDAAKGWDRPVYVHETAHALLVEREGLACDGNWVHEGFATALQARVHPASVTAPWARAFGALARREKSPFQPWDDALSDARPALRRYVQLATIVDFAAAKHRDAMPRAWAAYRGAPGPFHEAKARPLAEAFGTTPEALEAAWLAWGRATWPEPAPADPAPADPTPTPTPPKER
ncbi:MAG: hypothetical protein JNM10_12185 [Planctomycetia bacterium]|nr:hypothetical protein [Planctomycetia bacterium]